MQKFEVINGESRRDGIRSNRKITFDSVEADPIYMKSLQYKRFGILVECYLALLVWIAFGGLPALGRAPSSLAKEMLQPTYPEEFFFTASPKDV